MILGIKNKIERELDAYIHGVDGMYSLKRISPVLFKNIKDFLRRGGKRIRPILFVVGYLGFAKKARPGLYRSALSLELLHDFMLVHDDIIDKAGTRRGRPAMHAMFKDYLDRNRNIKFTCQDLAMVAGDVIYALALEAFLSVEEDRERKEAALKKLIEAALYTGSGEFIELFAGIKSLDKITKEEIYKIYDFKTANYTFASPMAIGATLAGADKRQIDLLFKYGLYLGRAFQIKDDILGMFSQQEETGKPHLTDMREAKKTLLIWYAYNNCGKTDKRTIKKIFSKRNAGLADLLKLRKIISRSGSLDHAKNEIAALLRKAAKLNSLLKIPSAYRNSLSRYTQRLLSL